MTQQNRRQFAATLAAGTVGLTALELSELRAQEPSALFDQFFEAVRQGNLERVRAFLAQDARLALARQADGLSAFATALKAHHPDIGQLLRQHGYQPDLHESALAQDWERLDQLAPQAPGQVNIDHPIGGSAMYAAAWGGAGADIWRIYRYGGAPSRAFPPHGSPLLAAFSHPDLPTAEMTAATLLANGADPNGTGRLGSGLSNEPKRSSRGNASANQSERSASNAAGPGPNPASQSSTNSARLDAQEAGVPSKSTADGVATVNPTENRAGDWSALCQSHGWTPLHLAARRGSREIVEMLIRKGADATVADFDGSTPLHLAQRANHQDAVRLLRHPERIGRDHSTSRRTYDAKGDPYVAPDLGAFATLVREQVVGASHRDLDAVRETLRTYPQLAHAVATTTEGTVEAGAHMGRRDMVALLLDHGAPYSLPTAVMRNDATGVAHLLDEDPDRIRERGAHDFPLLWYPIIGRTGPDMLEELLRRGAKVEQQHYLGTTALHFAAARDQAEMAEVLIAHGADVNRVGRKFSADGHTPLDLAGPKTTPLLRSHGAKPGKG